MEGPDPTRPHLVGVDVGASKILAGVFEADFRAPTTMKRSTKPDRGPDSVAARIARCIEDAVDEADLSLDAIQAVGVGVPGLVNPDRGLVRHAPALGWMDFPLGEILSETLGVPVFVENDGNLATLGVHALELRERPQRLLGIFIGSRISGGWIVDGRFCAGFPEAGVTVGHLTLDPAGPRCHCGHRGCFESLAGRKAVLDRIHAAIGQGRQSVVSETLEAVGRLRSRDLRRALRGGDPVVVEVLGSATRWMGVAIATLAQALRPEVIALGGSMAEALGDDLVPSVLRAAADHDPRLPSESVTIVGSSLGDHACISGAAWFARHSSE